MSSGIKTQATAESSVLKTLCEELSKVTNDANGQQISDMLGTSQDPLALHQDLELERRGKRPRQPEIDARKTLWRAKARTPLS